MPAARSTTHSLVKEDAPVSFPMRIQGGVSLRTMHTQRSSSLAFVDDTSTGELLPCAIGYGPAAASLLIGTRWSVSITRLLPVLGLVSNAEHTHVATISNPSLVFYILPGESEPQIMLTSVLRETVMVNIGVLQLDQKRNEVQYFWGTNEGFIVEHVAPLHSDPPPEGEARKPVAMQMHRLTQLPSSVNDMAMRRDPCGRLLVFVVSDSDRMFLFRRHGVIDGEPLSAEARTGRNFTSSCELTFDKYVYPGLASVSSSAPASDAVGTTCWPLPEASAPTPASPLLMESFFTYCAWSACGEYVAATADIDRRVMIWSFVDGYGRAEDSLVLLKVLDVDVKPYAIVAAGRGPTFAFAAGPNIEVYDAASERRQIIDAAHEPSSYLIGLSVIRSKSDPQLYFLCCHEEGDVRGPRGYRLRNSIANQSQTLQRTCADWLTTCTDQRDVLETAERFLSLQCPFGHDMVRHAPTELCHDRYTCHPRCTSCRSSERPAYHTCTRCLFSVCHQCVPSHVISTRKPKPVLPAA